jgi:hypothetical protein
MGIFPFKPPTASPVVLLGAMEGTVLIAGQSASGISLEGGDPLVAVIGVVLAALGIDLYSEWRVSEPAGRAVTLKFIAT